MNPLEAYSSKKLRKFLWAACVLTLVALAAMRTTGIPLETAAAPYGIISFEFAGTYANALEMMKSWEGMPVRYAGLNLAFDYFFMIGYGLLLACLTETVRRKTRVDFLRKTGNLFVGGMLLAALLDAVENIGLIRLYLGVESDAMAALAYWCAAIKFGLILLGLVYMLVTVTVNLLFRLS